jgi:Uma2 family endonuclease
MTVEEFLVFIDGRSSDENWELIEGAPMMMTGGTLAHARIAGNIDSALRPAARRRGCESLRNVLVQAAEGSAFEPDVMVRCGPQDGTTRTTDDAAIVVEVLSRSTMRRDRVLKFERYRAMPTMQQIVFVYQDSVRVESWLREHGDWLNEPVLITSLEDSLALPSLGGSLPLEQIYEGVTPSPLNEL